MRILYITTRMPFRHGGEGFFTPEIDALLDSGCMLRLLPRSRGTGEVEPGNERFQPITEPKPLLSPAIALSAVAEFARSPAATMRLLWTILTHDRLGVRAKNLAVLPKALFAGRVARHWRADHIHAQWASTTATMAWGAHVMSGVPWSFTAHRWDIVDRNLLPTKVTSASFVRLISQSGVDLLMQMEPQVDQSKVRVIHMGVDVPPMPPLDMPPATVTPAHPFTVLCPANLLPVKGHRYLLEAMALVASRGHRCKLLLAGAGPERDAITKQVQRLGLEEHVQLMGQLPLEEVMDLYSRRAVDAVALASVDLGGGLHEGIPVSLMEAMAHAVPVIGTDTGGIAELVLPGTGLLVPPQDPAALADAITSLITDPALRRRLAKAGRHRVADSFNVTSVVTRILKELRATTETR